MLHTKFKGHRPFGPGEKVFLVFYHIWTWRLSWSCAPDRVNELSFPQPKLV